MPVAGPRRGVLKRPAAAPDSTRRVKANNRASVVAGSDDDEIPASQPRATKGDLDERIEGFKKFCEQEEDISARGMYLKQYFNKQEMQALWNRLKTMRAKASGDAQEAWEKIEERGARAGKQEEKTII